MFDDQTRAASQVNLNELRRRASPAAAHDLNHAIQALNPLLRNLDAGDAATCRDPQTQPARASSTALGATAARRRAGRRDAGRAVRQPRHDVHARSPSVAGPYIQDSITERPAGARRGDPSRSRSSARSCANSERALPRAAARRQARCARAAPDLADAFEVGTPALQRSRRRSTSALTPTLRGAAALRRATRWSRSASSDLTSTRADRSTRRSRTSTPAQTVVQLRRRCGSATSPRCSARATATAPGSASSSSPRRRAPTTRAARRRRPANGGVRATRTTTCTPTRTRTPPRRASRKECEAGNETYVGRQDGHRQRPRQPGHDHDDDDEDRRSDGRRAATADDARSRARTAPARSPFTVGALVLVVVLRRRLLRLHQAHPVHARLPAQGRVRVGQLDPHELAGAHRRRQRRQGQDDRAPGRHERRRRDDGDRRQRACRSTRTRR